MPALEGVAVHIGHARHGDGVGFVAGGGFGAGLDARDPACRRR